MKAIGLMGTLLWVISTPLLAQQQTEMYIPIGQSPGLSGVHTLIGSITAVDAQNGVITLKASDGVFKARVTKATHIWLDQSTYQSASRNATLTTCTPGSRIEVKFKETSATANNQTVTADWVKIATAKP